MKEKEKRCKENSKVENKYKTKNQKGITLVALVITIIIIIILATVTINMAFGENGLIRQAQKAKDMAANSVTAEQEGMNSLMDEYANLMEEDGDIDKPDEFVDVLPSKPSLSEGMTPVKWNGSNWVKTTASDNEWYDYANKEWANVVLTPEEGENAGKDATGTVDVFNKDGTLNEDSAYTMLVWIPRYAYQITSGYHQSGADINPSDGTTGAGTIEIVFIDTNNQNKAKTETYSETYPNYSTGSGMEDYVVHPAFNYGGTKLNGFWVGKFETSHTGCTTEESTGSTDTNVTTLTAQIKAGVTSWRNIQVSNIFTVCTEMNRAGNPYGLNTSDAAVDPHMMKNSEWGAVAYLSQNTTYGKGNKIWNNSNNSYITGQSGNSVDAVNESSTNAYNEENGPQASTTGNITGVYDMRGGSWEYVAGYVNNSYADDYASNLVNAAEKYKDVYSVGSSDSRENDYEVSTPANGHYGDAVYETSSGVSSPYMNSWYRGFSYFPNSSSPFFGRSGGFAPESGVSVFCSTETTGYSYNSSSFRLVLPVL